MKQSFLKQILSEGSDREVDTSFTTYLHGYKKMQSIQERCDVDSLAGELTDYIEDHLAESVTDVQNTLYKHWKRGEYDTPLAERAWSRLVSEGAHEYASTVGKEPRLWEQMFSADIRQTIVTKFETNFYDNIKKGKES